MTLVHWAPNRDLDRVFDSFFGSGERRWTPAVDLFETDDALVMRADLPGMSEEDIEIEVQDGVLTVTGERESESESKIEGYYRFERAHGSFSRAIRLPKGIDPESVSARFDRGVLEVRIPRPEERKPHRIKIGAGDGARALEAEATEKE